MPPATKRETSFIQASTALIAAPIALAALIIALASVGPNIAALLCLAGAVGAMLVARLHTQGGGDGGRALADALSALSDGNVGEARRHMETSGLLSEEIDGALQALANRYGRAADVAETSRALEGIAIELTALSESLTAESDILKNARGSISDSVQAQSGMGQRMENLARSAEESSASILQMVTINNEVRGNVHNLATSVEETTTAIEEMTFSSKEVAKNIEDLSTAAEETAASMNQMDVSISQVETNANETSKLSEQVTSDAETGVGAINTTIQGIDKIKDSSRIAADVITNLGEKIDEIGNILNVIDDVAEQTNLLALNAAIIAAQAGEHGRGFAVVADEIKALAERTGASTKEIAILISAIQEESRNAVNVMGRGVEDVEEGVRLGHNAEDALRKIVDSAKRSTLMIQAIAQATVEQAKGSKQVTNAIGRIAETVQQIAYATAEQAKGAEHIMQSAERMKVITQQVERSADEQARGGEQVTTSIERIRDITERVSAAHGNQQDTSHQVTRSIEDAEGSGRRSLDLCDALSRRLGNVASELSNADRSGN